MRRENWSESTIAAIQNCILGTAEDREVYYSPIPSEGKRGEGSRIFCHETRILLRVDHMLFFHKPFVCIVGAIDIRSTGMREK